VGVCVGGGGGRIISSSRSLGDCLQHKWVLQVNWDSTNMQQSREQPHLQQLAAVAGTSSSSSSLQETLSSIVPGAAGAAAWKSSWAAVCRCAASLSPLPPLPLPPQYASSRQHM
jgi:hypothetical protein